VVQAAAASEVVGVTAGDCRNRETKNEKPKTEKKKNYNKK